MSSFKHRWLAITAVLSLSGALANACSASNGTTGASQGAGGSGTSTGSGGGASTGSLVTSSGVGGDLMITTGNGGSSTGSVDPDAGCAFTSSEASSKPQPADIIIAVDTSGSMDEESAQVQQNLNNFASLIINSGIDVHVILIADASVCIPMPLGSGACNGADEKLPSYRHVVQGVASTDALQKFIDTYPLWKDSLRPDATKTFAVVSDDDSDLGAADFTNQLLALDPPTFQKFKLDAIVSFDDSDVCTACLFGGCATCASKCCDKNLFCSPISAAEGKVYKQLVQQTGGVIGDLCTQNFAPVFTDMGTAVIQGSSISCEYAIPTVPDGGVIDPTKVNVSYTGGGASMGTPILHVPGGAAGCGQKGGWYYDNPASPTKIIMCPTTCTALQGNASGKVDVIFGCETQISPPE